MRRSAEDMNKVLGSSSLGKSIFPTFQIGVPMPPIATTNTGAGTTAAKPGSTGAQTTTRNGQSRTEG